MKVVLMRKLNTEKLALKKFNFQALSPNPDESANPLGLGPTPTKFKDLINPKGTGADTKIRSPMNMVEQSSSWA